MIQNLYRFKPLRQVIPAFLASLMIGFSATMAFAASIEPFVGDYSGSADVENFDGTKAMRNMSVSIKENKNGFSVEWSTKTHREDGTSKEKSYDISFVASDRPDVFAAAMTKNVFGHEVQMNPMKGEPYVWARIMGDTMTVYSLFVDADGGYELQQFDRTLAEGGLNLEFSRVSDGIKQRTSSAFLKRHGG